MSTNPQLKTVDELNEMARQIRRDIINMLLISKSGHSGGPLGLADIFTALYFNKMTADNEQPAKEDRDYFFLSIGHVAPVWYSTLARRGYFPIEELTTLRKINGRLQGHPSHMKTHGVPGVEIASGSLGQGPSIAVGVALGLKLSGKSNHVYCVCGDGELQEGQIWEAVMTGAHHHCNNLTIIIDKNDCQIDNRVQNVLNMDSIPDKFRAFNWEVIEIDGNDMQSILDGIDLAKKSKDKPTCIVAQTFMGKGVSFMEDKYQWHGVPPNDEQGKQALSELAKTKFGDFVDLKL